MKVTTMQYKDTPVMVREFKISPNPAAERRTCFYCGQKVGDCEAVLLINNYRHIPNMLMHTKCYHEYDGRQETLLQKIEDEYQEFKRLNELFGSW